MLLMPLLLVAQLTPLSPVAVFDPNAPQAPRELTCDDWMRRAPRCTGSWSEPAAAAQARERLQKTEAVLREECTRQRSCVPLAIALRQAGRGEEARPLLERACTGGNAWACAELGELLWRDRLVPQDFAAAHRAYAKACRADVRHCHALGRFLEYHGTADQMPELVSAYGKSCAQAEVHACTRLGDLFLVGVRLPRDEALARAWFDSACSLNSGYACHLAAKAARGEPEARARYLSRACALGFTLACGPQGLEELSLPPATPVWDGRDAPEGTRCLSWARRSVACRLKYRSALAQTEEEAEEALTQNQASCAEGSEMACHNVDMQLFNSSRRLEAVPALERRCERGSAFHCTLLGMAFAEGDHVPRDLPSARRVLKRACELDAKSCDRYAPLLDQGPAADPAGAEAARRRACNGRSAHSCYELGLALRDRDPSAAGLQVAQAWLEAGCELDDEASCYEAGLLALRRGAAGLGKKLIVRACSLNRSGVACQHRAAGGTGREPDVQPAPAPPEPQEPPSPPFWVPGEPSPGLGAYLAPVTAPPAPVRAKAAALLYRRHDAFFPLICVENGKLLPVDGKPATRKNLARCLALLPARPTIRLMDGSIVRLAPLALHPQSEFDLPPGRGWGLTTPRPRQMQTELAVWPPEADLGLSALPIGATDRVPPTQVLRESLERVGPGFTFPFMNTPERPVEVLQDFQAEGVGEVVSVATGLRGVFVNPGNGWRVLRLSQPLDLGTWLVARSDLDGDRQPEWLVFTKCVNGFSLELWPSDLRAPMAVYSDWGL